MSAHEPDQTERQAASVYPADRPSELEVAPIDAPWWRIDETRPEDWNWDPFPCAEGRFDPPSCRFRMRYAASSPVAAARERFPGRCLEPDDGDLWVVRLEGSIDVIDLTDLRTLDALGVDDRISTGRLDEPEVDPLLARSQALADAVWDWWDGDPPAIVYRTQSTPIARSLAFHGGVRWKTVTARPLRDARSVLYALAQEHGFEVPDWPITDSRDDSGDDVREVAQS